MVNWEIQKNKNVYFCQIDGDNVTVGVRLANGETNRADCSLEEFVGGNLQDLVRENLSETVLQQVLIEARELLTQRNR